jgi:ubiquinone/menaquinone biosynthesis C-methylase UbiE
MHEHDEQRDRLLDGWDQAAGGWARQADRTREESLPVMRWMVDAAELRPGMTVVELAAGPGDTGFMAAERIGSSGRLICSDGSQEMLKVAEERAKEQGVDNVEFKQLQCEWIDLETASADVILIKWGIMLLMDPLAAAKECRRVLKPGGRLVLSVWDSPSANEWTVLPQRSLADLGHIELPAPSGPGMFALAKHGKLQSLLEEAGFFEIKVETIAVPHRYASISDWLGTVIDLSVIFRSAWNQLGDNERADVRARLTELAADAVEADGSVVAAGSCLGASAEA